MIEQSWLISEIPKIGDILVEFMDAALLHDVVEGLKTKTPSWFLNELFRSSQARMTADYVNIIPKASNRELEPSLENLSIHFVPLLKGNIHCMYFPLNDNHFLTIP